MSDPSKSATEFDMITALHRRYPSTDLGNGPRYVCASHVRSAAGFDARRTADFMALDTWPSKGMLLHGHEIKVSRSDWLRELKDPSRAAEFMRHVDHWWLVVPDARIVRDDLPEGWGLLAMRGNALAVVRRAPRLTMQPGMPPSLPRSFLVPLMRAVQATAKGRAMSAERQAVALERERYHDLQESLYAARSLVLT